MIKNIIFDFGGVLVDWNPKYLYRKYFSSEQEVDFFLNNICTYEWNTQHDAGLPIAVGTKRLQKQYPEYSEAIQAYYDNFEDMLGSEIPGTADLLQELKRQGYKLYGLTNWSAETLPRAMKKFSIFSMIDDMVVSGEEKIVKPDHRLFKILLERYNLVPEECVFIDDNPNNVAAAKELNIKGIQFLTAEQTKAELHNLTNLLFTI